MRSGDTSQGLSLTLPPPALPAGNGSQGGLQASVQQTTPAGGVNALSGSSGMLNPEHGKPGHRCDIAVGAPLPAGTNPINPAQAVVTPAATAQVALNPEHGKPGHRCDIAVGAPLNSKPVEPPKPTKPTTATTVKSFNPADTVVAAGYNPQHGKPGHRCDVAVGAKLPETAEVKTDSTGSE